MIIGTGKHHFESHGRTEVPPHGSGFTIWARRFLVFHWKIVYFSIRVFTRIFGVYSTFSCVIINQFLTRIFPISSRDMSIFVKTLAKRCKNIPTILKISKKNEPPFQTHLHEVEINVAAGQPTGQIQGDCIRHFFIIQSKPTKGWRNPSWTSRGSKKWIGTGHGQWTRVFCNRIKMITSCIYKHHKRGFGTVGFTSKRREESKSDIPAGDRRRLPPPTKGKTKRLYHSLLQILTLEQVDTKMFFWNAFS